MDFQEVIKKRRSVRAYLNRPVGEDKLQKILEAANLSPSAGNLQAREIFIVRDPKKKEELKQAAFGQEFIAQAPIVLVFLANPERSGRKYRERGREFYAVQDATLAGFSARLQAVDLGLSCCWVGAFSDEEVKRILRADHAWKPVVIMPLGYRAEEPEPSSRRLLKDLVHKI